MRDYSQFIYNKPLNQVFLPGTHDSGTYHLENAIGRGQDISKDIGPLLKIPGVGKIFKNWARCQYRTINEQLSDGIRFFDFRIVYRDSKKDFYLVHGLYAKSLREELEVIAQFLKTHPEEIVIIQASHMDYMPKGEQSHQELISLIRQICGNLLAPASLTPQVTVGKLLENAKQLIFIYDASSTTAQQDPYLWQSYTLNSYWANSTNPLELKQKLDQHIQSIFTPTSVNNQYDFANEETASWIIRKNNPFLLNVPISYTPPPSLKQKVANKANDLKQETQKTAASVKEEAKKAGQTIKHWFKH